MTPHTGSESGPSTTGPTEYTYTARERAADRARVERIEAQIQELQHALGALQQEKDLLQDRLGAYTYPVLTLPNEMVSEIFLHFLPTCPPIISLHSPSLLGRICRKWRDIALSTPATVEGGRSVLGQSSTASGAAVATSRSLSEAFWILSTFNSISTRTRPCGNAIRPDNYLSLRTLGANARPLSPQHRRPIPFTPVPANWDVW
ncbi:hypothetical protein B0H17DRAFT_1126834 [Mycena rosella]|uniref:F-box domain-containing protein n=1 Tax=Mycena rosella TaxID=1033263 RepID=A0AAD7M7E2_MYCRO|nr:hypothetical protein B0H17DRAFT_1126834 [Mycena rosella]